MMKGVGSHGGGREWWVEGMRESEGRGRNQWGLADPVRPNTAKQPTRHTHLQLSPFHHHNWHPHCRPFKSEVSSTQNYLPIPPRTIPASCSNLSAWFSSSRLTPVLPHLPLSKILSILGNEKPGLVLKVVFCPPSILHLM